MNIVPALLRFALALLAQLVAAMPLAADDGDADPTFADGGQMSFVVAAPADVGNRILAITALADGALLATGFARADATGLDVAVARITADGVLDPGFGDLGVAVFDFAGHETMRQLSVEPDGRILLAGDRNSVHALVRLSAQGDLDTTFGSGGLAEIANPWPAASVGLGPLGIQPRLFRRPLQALSRQRCLAAVRPRGDPRGSRRPELRRRRLVRGADECQHDRARLRPRTGRQRPTDRRRR